MRCPAPLETAPTITVPSPSSVSSGQTREAWRRRQRARLPSIRILATAQGRGLGSSLIWTATLWLLFLAALGLAFKT